MELENNKIIAEFIGFKRYYPNMTAKSDLSNLYYYPYFDKVFHESLYVSEVSINGQMGLYKTYNIKNRIHLKNMQFNKSWDWLMPVLCKIEDLGYEADMFNDICVISNKNNKDIFRITKSGSSRIVALYNCILEFIKRYNNDN